MKRLQALWNLWFLRRDLQIARSTGRNPDHIAVIRSMIAEWEKVQWEHEIKARVF